MKNKKKKISLCLSILFIGFLVASSSLNINSLKASLEEKNNRYTIDSFESSAWNWATTVVVSTGSTGFSYNPSLAVDSLGNVHIVWESVDVGGTLADHKISYRRWEILTQSWTTTEIISTESTTGSFFPNIVVDSNDNLHVAWGDETDYGGCGADRDIFYKRWITSSSTWTTTEVVSSESTDDSYRASIAADSAGTIYIVWFDGTDYAGSGYDNDIFYKQWNASSSSWTSTEVVSTESTDTSTAPSLAADSVGNVHMAWQDSTDYAGSGTDFDVFYKRWNTSSSSWTITEVVSTESTESCTAPSLAVDSTGTVHIVWDDMTDYAGAGTDRDIFYKNLDASSSTWTIPEIVSIESTAYSISSSLVIDTVGNIHIAWAEQTDYAGSGTDFDVFYKHKDVHSSSWTITEVVSTESTEESSNPSIIVDSDNNIHVTWYDVTDYAGSGADEDIFYKFATTIPAAPELAFIIPNPTDINTVLLDWNNVTTAINYYVYRHTYYIWSVEGIVPIAKVSSSIYVDTLPSEGYYYYVIVAEYIGGNSSHSNCQYVEYKVPHLREFTIISSLILGAVVISLVIMRIRKNKQK